ncbi:MAG TPA: hypothetical protein VFZ76_13850 [Anaerolineales bacterium]
MKPKIKFALLVVLIIAALVPGTAFAKGFSDDRVITGGTFTLEDGETQDGNLVIFGGAVTLEDGSHVTGNVALLGGTIEIDGSVGGSVVGIGGVVSLGSTAVVDGDLTTMAASLNREEGAQVRGNVTSGFPSPPDFSTPGRVTVPDVPNVEVQVAPILNVMWFFFRTFLWAALAVLLMMFLPDHIERTATTIIRQPVLAGGVGLLTTIVAPLLLVGIAITIILIPVSLVGFLILAIAWFVGRIAIGYEIGRRFAETANQDWPPAVAAGAGTFILTFVIDGADALIPCVGWLIPALVGIVGLGGILLSRFGTQYYPQYLPRGTAISPASPPAPPQQSKDSEEESSALPDEDSSVPSSGHEEIDTDGGSNS